MVAATGVLVAAIYYVSNIRTARKNQELALKSQEQTLETRQAQLFMPIYSTFYSDDFLRAYWEIMAWSYDSYDEYISKYGYQANKNAVLMQAKVNMYLEGVGVLVKRGLIDPSFVDDLMSSVIISYWEKYRQYAYDYRVRRNVPQMGEYIEYLYNQIKPIFDSQYSGSMKIKD
jgi:hypothetical protein